MMLSEKPNAEPWVLRDKAFDGCEGADEEFQDGGFAGAVGSYDADSGVELDV